MRMVFLLFWLASSYEIPDTLVKPFNYDTTQPLDIQIVQTYDSDACKVYDITYASPKGGRVPAYLVVPQGKGPFGGIVFGHWGNGNRTEFLPEAELYARAGAISILPAYPWTRPSPWYHGISGLEDAKKDVEAYTQAIIDLRRAFDLLLGRSDVDKSRIAYIGHSYGAQWGAILTAVDRRMKTSILVGGVPDADANYLKSENPMLVEALRDDHLRGMLQRYAEGVQALDAIRYIKYAAPIPILFQFARFEQYFTESDAKRYFETAGEPKQLKWYDTGHDLNDLTVMLDRSVWLQQRIGTRSIVPILERRLKH